MQEEYGADVFIDGCPVCKKLCCCSNKSSHCDRGNHCYRKCPTAARLCNKNSDDKSETDEIEVTNSIGLKRTTSVGTDIETTSKRSRNSSVQSKPILLSDLQQQQQRPYPAFDPNCVPSLAESQAQMVFAKQMMDAQSLSPYLSPYCYPPSSTQAGMMQMPPMPPMPLLLPLGADSRLTLALIQQYAQMLLRLP